MISDTQLNTIAISFGVLSMGLILVYHVIDKNVKGVDEKVAEK